MPGTQTELVPMRQGTVELFDRGTGRPILFLHCGEGLEPSLPLLERLARNGRVVAASHPGFGRSDLPAGFARVDDLAYFYLDLLSHLDLRDTLLVGASFGAWIALEIAVRSTARLRGLVLADAVGLRFATDETAVEIVDIYDIPQDDLDRRSYVEPQRWRRSYDAYSDEELMVIARNREAHCLYGWSPYMHNPGLRRWLHRIDVPSLVLWGEADGIVSADYGRALAAALPKARFATIAGAAHHPHIEQPDRFAAAVNEFSPGIGAAR